MCQEEEAISDQGPESKEADSASRHWLEYQAGQQILLQTPSVLVGFRVEVYRTEGATQWYTAVIKSYNENTRELSVTDDTVLEEHNEDPALVQMKLIGDGGSGYHCLAWGNREWGEAEGGRGRGRMVEDRDIQLGMHPDSIFGLRVVRSILRGEDRGIRTTRTRRNPDKDSSSLVNRYTGCGRNRSPSKSPAGARTSRNAARGSSAATKCRPSPGLTHVESNQQAASAEKGDGSDKLVPDTGSSSANSYLYVAFWESAE
ncbi:putative JmjC domain-containing histone demethylation protein 2C [Lamellibrachia satsuma]|nr:putative JmjC domain-containing histone demethylation protein 2C [Lamellibrachia satsuma]